MDVVFAKRVTRLMLGDVQYQRVPDTPGTTNRVISLPELELALHEYSTQEIHVGVTEGLQDGYLTQIKLKEPGFWIHLASTRYLNGQYKAA